MASYAGSPALSPEARAKVLQTFRHTLTLAQSGKVDEALLGCDFLLKMDVRFAPARALLDVLRTAAPGTAIDVNRFSEFLGFDNAVEAPTPSAEVPVPHGGGAPAPPAALSDAFPATAPDPARAPGGLDDLVFGDEHPAPGPASAPAFPTPSPSPVPPQSMVAPVPGGDPFAGLDGLKLGEAPPSVVGAPIDSPDAPPTVPAPAVRAAALALGTSPAAAPKSLSGMQSDPRITQFLKQGDEALARGNPQEAIDLWSRVFLIDLSNEEASRRIDAAREAQAESARKIDVLLTEGVQSYEAGDLAGARNKFLDVLALSENDATARGYLNQIDAALSSTGAGGPPASLPPVDSDFMRNEIEAPQAPSFAEEAPGSDGTLGAPPEPQRATLPKSAGRGRLDLRVLIAAGLVLVAVVAAGTYWFLRGGRSTPAAGTASGPRTTGTAPRPADDPFLKAQALFDAGKIDDAIAILAKLPDADPRHNEALVRIEKMKSSAAPTPAPTAPSDAALNGMRVAGFTAMSTSRYIDAVKNLDPVVKAHPQDTEAAVALQKARDQVAALSSAVRSYNEGDYESAIKLLWEMRKQDNRNQDVEEYLVNAYVNAAIQAFQAGNMSKAATALKEATELRPNDGEAQRLLRFARKYPRGATDLLAKTLVKHLTVRP